MLSNIAIILFRKGDKVELLPLRFCILMCVPEFQFIFNKVSWAGLLSVIVAFDGHIYVQFNDNLRREQH